PRDARDFRRERAQLIDHRVDGVLELEDLALDVDRDLLGEVAGCDRLGHVGDVPYLRGQVAGHEVHAVGEVLPGAGAALHVRTAVAYTTRFRSPRDARDFRRERAQLIDHRVDGVLELQDLALHVDRDLLREIAAGDRRRDLGDVPHLAGQVAGHRVHA